MRTASGAAARLEGNKMNDVDSLAGDTTDTEDEFPNDLIVGFDEESEPAFPVMKVGRLGADPAGPSELNVDLLEIRAWRSQLDGTVVVQIDTVSAESERLRVNVNDGHVYDGAVFDADPEAGDHGREMLDNYYGELQARFESTKRKGHQRRRVAA